MQKGNGHEGVLEDVLGTFTKVLYKSAKCLVEQMFHEIP
jgi:hypothetical protein